MKFDLKMWAQIAILSACCGQALPQTPSAPDSPKVSPVSEAVSRLEEEFLSNVENASGRGLIFDKYESDLKRLMREYPGESAPFGGLMELFEKCEPTRTLRILDESLDRTDLPEKIRVAYQNLRKTAALVGAPIELAFTALDGRPIRLDQFHGKVVVIDFWATWCGPCIRELPKLQTIYDKHQRDGLVIVGISFDREQSKLESFVKARQIPWTQIYPTTEEREKISRSIGVSGGYLPTVFIIGKDGRLRHTLDSRFRIEEKITALLQE